MAAGAVRPLLVRGRRPLGAVVSAVARAQRAFEETVSSRPLQRVRLRRLAFALLLLAAIALALTELPFAAGAYRVPIALALLLTALQAASLPLAALQPHVAAPLSTAASLALAAMSARTELAWPWWIVLLVGQAAVLAVVAARVRWFLGLGHWLVAMAAAAGLAAALRPGDGDEVAVNLVIAGGVTGAVMLLSLLLSQWSRMGAQLLVERRANEGEVARRVLAEERTRIARELHDVVAHSMSIITVQSTTARYRHPDLDQRAVDELEQIGELSRQALDEMRGLLTVLRGDDTDAPMDPQPGITGVPDLVQQAERAGMAVTLEPLPRSDAAAVPDVVGLAAYRIVQEALSNAIRHAPHAAVRVACAQSGDTLTIRVENGPSATPRLVPPTPRGRGHGLVGMRERAISVGGRLTAEASPDGGFRVLADLPLPVPGGTPA
ncbi:histidine kinase [Amnibacterium sp. CER49]|uniref:sensor histidine kinase n=1 Tax=Amnibacterium sp. CER49 TaxID=3039161 RepID=UPI0024487225|nr:histidine kinase [Amnibacterium sp. CER49]MDH2444034.1 histidine kinase [Amnibacterium sp. CER49]